MKRLTPIVFAIAAAACAFLIIWNLGTRKIPSRPASSKSAVLTRMEDESVNEYSEEVEKAVQAASQMNRIPILKNEVLLSVTTINLDADQQEEQILVLKKSDDLDERIRIAVADYETSRDGYIRSWEGISESTKIRTFSLTTKDLVGDHNLDIVCIGMNDRNEQTLTVFWKTPSASETALTYTPICRVSGDSVLIQEIERSEGYQLGQIEGASWPIVRYTRDPDSSNILDQVETTFTWNDKDEVYEVGQTVKIPGQKLEEKRLTELLNGDSATFERFLDGLWYKISGPIPGEKGAQILMFDRERQNLTFASDDIQEVYKWDNSHSTRYGLYISCLNESVSALRRFVDIELTGTDTIALKIFDALNIKIEVSGKWDGQFRQMSEKAQSEFYKNKPASVQASFTLSGVYSNREGAEITFTPPNFVWSTRTRSESGGYAYYAVNGANVLVLKYMQKNGIVSKTETYSLKYSEKKEGENQHRVLTLVPARVGINGVEPLDEASETFEQ